jgi:hypothetical protein
MLIVLLWSFCTSILKFETNTSRNSRFCARRFCLMFTEMMFTETPKIDVYIDTQNKFTVYRVFTETPKINSLFTETPKMFTETPKINSLSLRLLDLSHS